MKAVLSLRQRRLIETSWACDGALAVKAILPARNRYTELTNRGIMYL